MTFNFANEEHEETYHQFCKNYTVDPKNRDYNLLFYLLAAIADKNCIDDLIEYKGNGRVQLKLDALHNGWVTGGDAQIIRLAFHLFNYGTPTVYYYDEDQIDKRHRETTEYYPVNLLDGLDYRLTDVALEALRMYCYWYN